MGFSGKSHKLGKMVNYSEKFKQLNAGKIVKELKTHEVSMVRGSIGMALVYLALTVMSSKEETNWEHFHSFGDMFGR